MIQKIVTKFKGLNPFIQGIASLLTIIVSLYTILGGFNNADDESSDEFKNKVITLEPVLNENTSTNSKKTKTFETINKNQKLSTDNEHKKSNKNSLFQQLSKKNSNKTTISIFILRNGKLDSKTQRAISNSIKNLNSTNIFNNESITSFNDFMSPSKEFLKLNEVNKYLDYYLICDITSLKTEKNSVMNSFTSTLNIEGYLINVNNNNSIRFPYNNIKGAGFSENDAEINLNEDLQNKLTHFIESNI